MLKLNRNPRMNEDAETTRWYRDIALAVNQLVDSVTTLLAYAATNSMVRLNTANGYGSTNTKIRRFTNVVTNQGSDITYADSPTLGASFTINTAGMYSVSFTDQYSAIEAAVITLNDSAPTATPVTADILDGHTQTTGNLYAFCSWSGYLAAGAVIRARSYSGTTTGAGAAAQFTIAKVG